MMNIDIFTCEMLVRESCCDLLPGRVLLGILLVVRMPFVI